MRELHARRGIAVAALAAGSVLILTSCSSDSEPAAESASASAASSEAAAPSESAATVTPAGAAAAACAAYFDLDLLNSDYAGGAVEDGDITEEQVREQFRTQLKELVAEAKLAVEDGSADRKLVINAKRMKKIANSLDKDQALSELSKAKQTRFAKSSLRVQKACDRAGFPLPADNVTARTAAGL
jgi:pyruvate/2-oxoglutarate dehydrogenase complex dihydrolipoamide acyltransferase (E2) component